MLNRILTFLFFVCLSCSVKGKNIDSVTIESLLQQVRDHQGIASYHIDSATITIYTDVLCISERLIYANNNLKNSRKQFERFHKLLIKNQVSKLDFEVIKYHYYLDSIYACELDNEYNKSIIKLELLCGNKKNDRMFISSSELDIYKILDTEFYKLVFTDSINKQKSFIEKYNFCNKNYYEVRSLCFQYDLLIETKKIITDILNMVKKKYALGFEEFETVKLVNKEYDKCIASYIDIKYKLLFILLCCKYSICEK